METCIKWDCICWEGHHPFDIFAFQSNNLHSECLLVREIFLLLGLAEVGTSSRITFEKIPNSKLPITLPVEKKKLLNCNQDLAKYILGIETVYS